MTREDPWYDEPEPVGYEIEEVGGRYQAYLVSQYRSGKVEEVGSLALASGRSRASVERRAAKGVHRHHREWADRRDEGKRERVIMYQKPPTVGPKGPAGTINVPRRAR